MNIVIFGVPIHFCGDEAMMIMMAIPGASILYRNIKCRWGCKENHSHENIHEHEDKKEKTP